MSPHKLDYKPIQELIVTFSILKVSLFLMLMNLLPVVRSHFTYFCYNLLFDVKIFIDFITHLYCFYFVCYYCFDLNFLIVL